MTLEEDALKKRMRALHIKEEDLVEKFILGTGSGGQKINKTSSCVFLKHLPSGIQIKCQRGRSRSQNRYYAMVELCERLEERERKEKAQLIHDKEKRRRQKRKRTIGGQEKVLESKRQRSSKKFLRKVIKNHDDS